MSAALASMTWFSAWRVASWVPDFELREVVGEPGQSVARRGRRPTRHGRRPTRRSARSTRRARCAPAGTSLP